jgi:hypothetical protein
MEDAMVMDSIGADYLLLQIAWDSKHSGPELMEQLFHLFDAPNRFGLPAFYTPRVWAWKENPNGTFVDWHPNVSCEAFADRFGEELGKGHTPPYRIHRAKGTKSKDNPVGYRFLSLIKGEPS